MRKAMLICLMVFSIFMGTAPVRADWKDLLKDLDSAMEGAKTGTDEGKSVRPVKADKDLPAQVADHFRGEVRVRGYFFLEESSDAIIGLDTERAVGDVQLKGSTWVGKGFWSLHAGAWLEAGSQDNTYKGMSRVWRDRDRHRRYLELNELCLVLSGEQADLILGRRTFQNGISTLFSPANRYRPLDLNDPTDPRDLGSWQATLNYYMDDTTFTASVMPLFQPMKVPPMESQWIGGSLVAELPDINLNSPQWNPFPFTIVFPPGSFREFVQMLYFFWDLFFGNHDAAGLLANRTVTFHERLPGSSPSDYGWFGRVKTSAGMWDLFASAYSGPGLYPVLKLEDRGGSVAIIQENPKVFNLAAGFATTWKKIELHGEALYNHTYDDRDDSYINYVVGITYSPYELAGRLHVREIDLSLEYAGEVITRDQDHTGYPVNSRFARIGRDDIFASVRVGVTDDISLNYLSDIVLWNRSSFHRLGASYRIQPGLVWGIAVELFSGGDRSYFGRWRNNDRVLSTLTWSF